MHRCDSSRQIIKQLMEPFFLAASMDEEEKDEFMDLLYHRHTVESQSWGEEGIFAALMDFLSTTVIPHKILVFQAGERLLGKIDPEMRWRLIVHDMSKICHAELYGYWMKYGKGYQSVKDYEIMAIPPSERSRFAEECYQRSWLHHIHHNDHHPEYWHMATKMGNTSMLKMEEEAFVEMVCDWMGATKSYGGNFGLWLDENVPYIKYETWAMNPDALLAKARKTMEEWA